MFAQAIENIFSLSIELMLYGLAGVFGALGVIWASVAVITRAFPQKEEKPE